MNPDTNEPTDDLTAQAASMIAAKGSSATKVSQVIDNQDQAVFTAIQEGIDRANAKAISNAATVSGYHQCIQPRTRSFYFSVLG